MRDSDYIISGFNLNERSISQKCNIHKKANINEVIDWIKEIDRSLKIDNDVLDVITELRKKSKTSFSAKKQQYFFIVKHVDEIYYF